MRLDQKGFIGAIAIALLCALLIVWVLADVYTKSRGSQPAFAPAHVERTEGSTS